MGIVDVRAGPADPAVGVFQGIAQAVVETLAVELGLADIVAPAPVGAADSRVQGFQDTEPCPGLGRPLQSSPVRARMRASVARFVALQDFPAALRIRPWVSISSASAWSSRASRKISSMRSALVVMVSFYPRPTISSARIAKAGLFPGKRPGSLLGIKPGDLPRSGAATAGFSTGPGCQSSARWTWSLKR